MQTIEAQAECKGGNKKGKGKKGKEKEKKEEQTPVVSTVIVEIPDQPSGSTSAVPTTTFNTDAICFYIQCRNMWMLDSRCTHHITSDKNNFTVYRPLPALQIVWFADQKAYTTYIGIGTVKGTTWVRGETKQVILNDVLHSPDIGGHLFSILKVRQKGFQTMFSRHNATVEKDGKTLLEATLHGNHYWATLSPLSASVNLIVTRVLIEILHPTWSSIMVFNTTSIRSVQSLTAMQTLHI